ncbi:MAG: hypothetical protein HQL09_04925 [Nitrospirae bacterium]|nr:hypothetical protein [Nitrospirota bacterium]
MPKTARHTKEDDMLPVERKKGAPNSMSCSIDSDFKSEKDNLEAARNRQVPFEVLLQIMTAYSNFLSDGTIKPRRTE